MLLLLVETYIFLRLGPTLWRTPFIERDFSIKIRVQTSPNSPISSPYSSATVHPINMRQNIALYFSFISYVFGRCPPSGPVLPPPDIPPSVDFSNLSTILNNLSHNDKGWNASTTSFSIDITSMDATFFTYHYTAPLRSASGTRQVDNNTVFRVASVTKVFTVLAILLENRISQEDPISKYVPELFKPQI